jgi:hypothetical protein
MRRMAQHGGLESVSDEPNALPWGQRIDTMNLHTVRAPRSKQDGSTHMNNSWLHRW